MQRYILLFLLCGGVGFAGGFYLAVAFQRQIEVLVSAAVVLAVLTWLGSGAELLGLLRDWCKDQREQESIPRLGFNGFYKKKDARGGEYYFVKVDSEGGEGRAKEVTGHGEVKEKLDLKEANWLSHSMKSIDITTHEYLSLFTISRYKEKTVITFPGIIYYQNEPDFERQLSLYEDYEDKKLIVEIHASRGRIKEKHLERKIKDIFNEAKEILP